MRFTLYPIYWLADNASDEPFDKTALPFDLVEGATIESVSERFRAEAFGRDMRERLGTEVVGKMECVRYAIVHRYEGTPIVVNGEIVGEAHRDKGSEALLRNLAACLRLIRPMRQDALLMRGRVTEDGNFDDLSVDIPPLHLIEVPEVQKLFALRNRDADELRAFAPEFLRAMRGDFWKFRMAVDFHERGHFQPLDWKARFLFWCSAIESIYTSHHREHKGSLVATSRIKWLLGENTNIYSLGDIPEAFDLEDPHITINEIVGDLYDMRNFIAHGDKIPDAFLHAVSRQGLGGNVSKPEVLLEAASFIVRTSLLKILRDGLLDYFADAGPAETFFGAQNLTKSALYAARRAAE
jgi:hypothetical protein